MPPEFSFKAFVSALISEIKAKMKVYGAAGFNTVYIGGGTPSLVPAENVELLCNELKPFLRSVIPSSGNSLKNPGYEWTVEMNPSDISREMLLSWQEGGVSRLSLGIQSFDEKVLDAVFRRNSPEENFSALNFISCYWKGDLSVDFIAGLPSQTADSLLEDIKAVLNFSPSHISLYQLSLEEKTPLWEMVSAGKIILPSEDESADIWFAGKNFLEGNGFRRYEISNFSRPGFESKHNLTYWRLNSFIGAGPGASGTLVSGNTCIRYENTRDVGRWLSFWLDYSGGLFSGESGDGRRDVPMEVQCVSSADFALETLMMGLRLCSGINADSFSRRFGVDIYSCVGTTLDKWAERGRLRIEGGRVFLTEEGLLFLNRFLCDCAEEIDSKRNLFPSGESRP